MGTRRTRLSSAVGHGLVASLVGTTVMTVFQRAIEIPLTGREVSYAPANFAQKVLRIEPSTTAGRNGLNAVTHYALGGLWGAALGVAASRGLRGLKAVPPVFAVVYASDGLLNTALGLYHPSTWDAKDVLVDVGDKLLQATATAVVLDRMLDRRG